MEMPKKEIEIDWNGKKEKVVIRRLSFAETGEISDIAAPIKLIGGKQSVTMSQNSLRIESLLRGIESAPFKIDRATITGKEFPNSVGEVIYKAIDEFNSFNLEKKED